MLRTLSMLRPAPLCAALAAALAVAGEALAEPYPFEAGSPLVKAKDEAAAGAVLKPGLWAPSSAFEPLRVSLSPDEKACRERWGEAWYVKCRRTFARTGARASGVAMTPAVKGEWRWEGSDIVFTPSDPWPSAMRFEVSLEALSVPADVKLTTRRLAFATPPMALLRESAGFRFDPDPKGERWIVIEGRLTTAADRAAFERTFKLASSDPGLTLGAPEFLWDEHFPDEFYVKVRVSGLAKAPAQLIARIPGAAGAVERRREADGSLSSTDWVVPKGRAKAELSISVPGETTLFQVTGVRVETALDEKLDERQRVVIETSLSVTGAELLRVLKAYELPEKLSDAAASPADWTAAGALDPEFVAKGRPLALELVDDAGAPATEHAFLLSGTPGRSAAFVLPAGFAPQGGPALGKTSTSVVRLPDASARIEFLQPGTLLTVSGEKRINFRASGLDELDWRIERVRDPFLALAADGWNVLNHAGSEDERVSARSGTLKIERSSAARFAALDFSKVLEDEGPGLYRVELEGIVIKDGRRDVRAVAARRLLVTDTGLVAKENADRTLDVFALSLTNGKPAAGARVRLLGANGATLLEARTDASGRAHLGSSEGFVRERRPAALILETASGDLSWMSLADASNRSNLTRFATGGRSGGDLAAAVFADRGLARPGETLRFSAILSSLKGEALPADLPVRLRLTDAAGRTVKEEVRKAPADGLLSLEYPVAADMPPGLLRMDVLIGERISIGTTSALVEDYAPETLTLTAAAPAAAGWLAPEDLSLTTTLVHAAGGAAEGRTVAGTLEARPLEALAVPDWPEYTFLLPDTPAARARTLRLAETSTDPDGRASVSLPLSALSGAAYAVNVSLEGRELEGGRAATEFLSFTVSPARAAAGWRLLGTSDAPEWIARGSKAELEFVLVDRNARPLAHTEARIVFSKRTRATELAADASGRLEYREHEVTTPLAETLLRTDASGRMRAPLPAGESGDFAAVVRLASGEGLGRFDWRVAGDEPLDAVAGELRPAEVRASLQKTDLAAGEATELSLVSPFDGTALVTLEGDAVEAAEWLSVRAGENVLSWRAPEHPKTSGRMYLHVGVVRTGEKALDALQKSWSETIVPVSINRASRTAALQLSAPERAPEAGRIPVTVRTEKPARIFLWAVDEGILSLTNYRTPDPAHVLLDDRALSVGTRQVLEDRIPEGILPPGTISAWGGGFAEARAAAGFVNPFKRAHEAPALWWGGIVETGPEGKTVEAVLPDVFNGRVRIMAAGVEAPEAERAGRLLSAQSTSQIVRPLMLEPIVPTHLAPGDRFRAAALATLEKDDGCAVLKVSGDGFGEGSAQLVFDGRGSKTAGVDLTAPAAPGARTLTFSAEAEGLTETRSASVSVRPAAPFESWISGGALKAGAAALRGATVRMAHPNEAELELSEALLPFLAETTLTVSHGPEALLPALIAKTTADPEQFWPAAGTSARDALLWSALGDEALARRTGLDAKTTLAAARTKRLDRLSDDVSELLGRQGLRDLRWDAPDAGLTALALDVFLTDRETVLAHPDAGAYGRSSEIRKLSSALLAGLGNDPETTEDARDAAYALWVLTREGTLVADRLERLNTVVAERRLAERNDALFVLAASAAKRMRMSQRAEELLPETIPADTTLEMLARAAAALADPVWAGDARAAALEKSVRARLLDEAYDALALGTLDADAAAQTARALLAAPAGATPAATLACTRYAAGFEGGADAAPSRLSAPGCLVFRITGQAPLEGLGWSLVRSGYAAQPPVEPLREGLEIERIYLNAEGKPAQHFSAGERAAVEIRIRPYGVEPLKNLAVTDLLPGGFVSIDPPGAPVEPLDGSDAAQTLRAEDCVRFVIPSCAPEGCAYRFEVRAAVPGTYAAAPVLVESTLDAALRARSTAQTITIEPEH